MPTSKNFAWINFRELPGLRNFALIYFREDSDFEKIFLPTKETLHLAFVKESDSDWLSLIMNKKICLLPISRFFLITGVIQKIRWLRGGNLTKRNRHCLTMYFLDCFKICEKGEEWGQNWETSKACTFWVNPYQFQATPMNLFRVD